MGSKVEHKNKEIRFRVQSSIRDIVKEKAKDNGESIANLVRRIVMEWAREEKAHGQR